MILTTVLTPREMFVRDTRSEVLSQDILPAGHELLSGKAYREAMAGGLKRRLDGGIYEAWQFQTLEAEYRRLASLPYDGTQLK